MGNKWNTVRLGDYCIKIGSGATPKGGNSVYTDTGNTYFIRSQNVYNDGFNTNGLVFITDEAALKLKNVDVQESDILLNITGDSVARVCIAPRAFLPARVNQHVAIIRPKNDAFDPRFLRYFLSSPQQQALLLTLASAGATRNALTKGMIEDLQVPKPHVRTQISIANVLEIFDKKIESNNKINQTLEQMSQTLFKSWFVDFDPVIDNALDAGNPIPEVLQFRAELRQKVRNSADFKPLPADIRTQFPAEFEETEMGWVPTEWKNGNLSDVTKILSGFAFKSKDFGDNGKSVIKIKNITSAKTIDVDDTQKISEFIAKNANRFLLFDGDILMAMTGATVGKFGVLTTKNNEEYYLNQRVAKFETENKAYLYCVLNQESTDRFITNAAQGSAQPNISAKDILSMPLLIPSVELINTFNDFISHIFYRMITNTKANLNLTALRDTLLPKLISGELSLEDLPDLIKQTEAA
ncbi:restriction endonuclease subunit S [Enterobacter cloacae]|uniref:restriction endonuclease subunit S n=1 Tax=Enterobacter cloacae TaxID=550 RepID=UPI001232B8E5|nr:restriction endonuclease subunit S [Enterobacter cloacae]KAA5943577.1 restriction endonuclease subunit S [Enterobacter cloacae]